ncbi:MAG TPA: phosphatidylglycerophosphatase A [Anaeromyxobacteraceae bacterium]|nr:phosphatidylglycerophosphatase A [Anaeromyxobacteraceae bacterium]
MTFLDRLRAVGSRRGARPASPPGGWVLLAAWGPCGFSPVAPGTVGTLGAVPLWWALSRLPDPALPAATLALTLLGVVAAGRAGRYWGVTDASAIVIDEVVGYLVTVALVPFSWRTAALGFVLFRIFDVTKPWPASVLDRVKSAWGVMLDDVAAGLYAMAILTAAVRWLPEVF